MIKIGSARSNFQFMRKIYANSLGVEGLRYGFNAYNFAHFFFVILRF